MSKLTLNFENPQQLEAQLAGLAETFFGVSANGREASEALTRVPSIALFTTNELLAELTIRTGAPATLSSAPAVLSGAPTPVASDTSAPVDKPKRARPAAKKTQGNGGAEPTSEPPPAPAAVPATPSPVPDKRAESPAPELPNEDDIMNLMSQVYSASNDMELLRNLMLEVAGKTQLSQIPLTLWPALVQRLEGELARLKGAPA